MTTQVPRYRHRRTAVIALGGNALAPTGQRVTIHDQFRFTRESLGPIVELALAGWSVCLVHGNGPQVGDELVRNEVAREEAMPLPLGVLVAATSGWIGYMVQQSLENALRRAGSRRSVATVVTQVQVDPADPSLRTPTKFIGRELTAEQVRAAEADGHVVKKDANGRMRRVVGSPAPLAIVEIAAIRTLVEKGILVIAAGGGGAPVQDHPSLGWEGIDAVVDKDLAAAVLARDIGAELLMVLTDVDAVYAHWGTPDQRPLGRLSADAAARMDADGAFGEGSMAPKIRAAVDFVRRTNGRAIITSLRQGLHALRGTAGTTITATETE